MGERVEAWQDKGVRGRCGGLKSGMKHTLIWINLYETNIFWNVSVCRAAAIIGLESRGRKEVII